MNKIIENNIVNIQGKVVSDFEFSHEIFSEGFYIIKVEVERISKIIDTIPVTVSERMIDINKDYTGQYISVNGQLRSYNKYMIGERKRLILTVFAREIEILEDKPDDRDNVNDIEIKGFICKPVQFRTTPLGREITDLLIAINRPYGKSDYIPCICWGRNARFAENLKVGTYLQLWGRIQSRDYRKRLSETEVEERTAYEVSVSQLKIQ